MTYKNSVELTGIVGAARHTTVSGKRLCHFNVATNLAYKTSDGCPVIETTWHDCQYWEKDDKEYPVDLKRGTKVHVCGMLVNQRYTGTDGVQRNSVSIRVHSVKMIDGEGNLEMEIEKNDKS